MKTTLLSLFVFLISLSCFSQSLEGEWNGFYTYRSSGLSLESGNFQIRLKFVLNKDSSYTVFSNSFDNQHFNFNCLCSVSYKRINADSIYLEEQRIIEPADKVVVGNSQIEACHLQSMYLRIEKKKKSMVLQGEWISKQWRNRRGEISFVKKQIK
jgi:hypothetical protein